jgi:hypothetical protein
MVICRLHDGGCGDSGGDDDDDDYDDYGYEPHKSAVGAIGGAALVGMEKGGEVMEVDI